VFVGICRKRYESQEKRGKRLWREIGVDEIILSGKAHQHDEKDQGPRFFITRTEALKSSKRTRSELREE
jgi:hypothetical protein